MARKNRKAKKIWYILAASVSVAALMVGTHSDVQKKNDVQQVQETADTIALVNNPISSVCFVNDTLEHYVSALLTYQNNKIVRNFVKNSKYHRMQLPYFAHEWWHHHNKKIKYWLKIKYSPSQFAQLRMHEEISANVAAILTADLEYQLAEDKNAVIKKYENTYMGFYFQAIKDGSIKPESTNQEALDKKYTLLINGAISMWERLYRAHYSRSLNSSIKQYLRDFGFRKPYPDNYQKILTHMYTFGGVDLSRYIVNDASFLDVRVSIFDEMSRVKMFNRSIKEREALINDVFQYAPYLKNFSASQRASVLEHIIIASRLKLELEKLNSYALKPNTPAITVAYHKVMHELSKDRQYALFIDKCRELNIMPSPQALDEPLIMRDAFPVSRLLSDENKKIISKIYQFRDVDLTKLIKNFDMNILPSDKEQFMQISIQHFTDKPMAHLINETPMDFMNAFNEDSTAVFAHALTTHQPKVATAPASRSYIKRVSKELFVNVPNFEENLLHPQALTPKARKQLAALFAEFNAIPKAFKDCDIEETQQFIRQQGNPHYFESKEQPFLPVKPSKLGNVDSKNAPQRNNLATIRRLNNRRSSEH